MGNSRPVGMPAGEGSCDVLCAQSCRIDSEKAQGSWTYSEPLVGPTRRCGTHGIVVNDVESF